MLHALVEHSQFGSGGRPNLLSAAQMSEQTARLEWRYRFDMPFGKWSGG